ncbi:unnamed protein product [Caenorhabditis angaria]|uniref:Uncharacterized protein n=1 Tax=Caenorhabditis angaria TaxID=860376 RepID=A0A9P1N8P0_9PELO|nr:unnamed protein product [Caenorhabditis angaria]
MGAVISQLGFNQPFLLALAVIVILLGLTVVVVGSDSNDTMICDYTPIPQIRILPSAATSSQRPRKNM